MATIPVPNTPPQVQGIPVITVFAEAQSPRFRARLPDADSLSVVKSSRT